MSDVLKRKSILLLLILAVAAATLVVTEEHSDAASGKYWIKINKQKCVTTVYKYSGGKWKPYRAMLCAVGKASTPTPAGTFHLGAKFRWIRMVTEGVTTFEQYTTRFRGQYYLHSPCYGKRSKSKEKAHTFYTLGKHVTHGCVRFAVMDAKWIYENCPSGTKVTIYSSSNPGPLGKPAAVKYVKKHGRAWDPTDPDPKNKKFNMRPPKFTFNKASSVLYGGEYDLKSGVKVMNTNAIQNLTGQMKLTRLTRNGTTIKVGSFSTRNLGEYKATYYVKDKYCIKSNGKGTSRTFTFKVIDKTTLSGIVERREVDQNSQVNLMEGVKATALSGDLTGTIKVTIQAEDGSKTTLSAAQASAYVFSRDGEFKVTYAVTNPYPKTVVSKTAVVKVNAVDQGGGSQQKMSQEQDAEGSPEEPAEEPAEEMPAEE